MDRVVAAVFLLAGVLALLLGVNLTRGPSSDTGPVPAYGIPMMLLGGVFLYRGVRILRRRQRG